MNLDQIPTAATNATPESSGTGSPSTQGTRLLLVIALIGASVLVCGGCQHLGPDEAEPVPTHTGEMDVPEDFLFPTSFQLSIEVDVSNRLPGRSYFQVCSRFEKTSESSYVIDYGSCLLRGPIIDGKLNHTVNVANHMDQLIVELLQFDETTHPEYHLFETAELRESSTLQVL